MRGRDMTKALGFAKRNWKAFLLGASLGLLVVMFTLPMHGCSTVSGIATDIGAMSEATRAAMSGEGK